MLKRGNLCSAVEARHFYQNCIHEEELLGIEWVHDSSTLPLVKDSENVLSKTDYDFHNINEYELGIRASFILMPDTVRLRVREGNALIENSSNLLRVYNSEQVEWMRRSRQFLEEREHHPPEALEFVKSYFENGTPVYFKIREVMLYPERFKKVSDTLRLRDILHGGTTVQHRLYGEPKMVPRKIERPAA